MGMFYSDTLEAAIKLLYFQADESRFLEGVSLLEKAVANGEPDAFYFLARCYGWGDGNVKANEKKAKSLSKQGIQLGSDLCVLGAERMDILEGDIKDAMTKELKTSFDNVLRVAEQGEPMAQYAIGLFYFWGDMLINFQRPSQKDFLACEKANAKEALKWFRRSAEKGCIPAFRNAFNSVRNGVNGVEKDPKGALCWVETMVGKVDMRTYYHSIFLEYEKLKNYEAAARWGERGVMDREPDSTVDLGLAYLSGNTAVKMDEAKALELFKKAYEWGSCYGSYNVGRCYYYGWGAERNYMEAFRWFDKADHDGHPSAKWYLAYCYCLGRGTQKDPTKGVMLIRMLQRQNKNYPKELLGYCLLHGEGTAQNYDEAKRILEEAAQSGIAMAWKHLGDMYDQGLGVPENVSLAASCYQKAVDAGASSANKELLRFKKTLFGKWKRK